MSNRQLAVLIIAIAALFFVFRPADAAPAQSYYPQQADPAGCAAANPPGAGGFYVDACKPAYQVQP